MDRVAAATRWRSEPPWRNRMRKRSSPRRSGRRRTVGYAVVGLGHIAQVAVLPAFAHATTNSRLVALVSDDATKRRKVGARYGVTRTYGYDDDDACPGTCCGFPAIVSPPSRAASAPPTSPRIDSSAPGVRCGSIRHTKYAGELRHKVTILGARGHDRRSGHRGAVPLGG